MAEVIQEPLHGTKLTRVLRKVGKIYNKVNLIIEIVIAALFLIAGVIFLPIGIVALSDPTIFADAETTIEAVNTMGIVFISVGASFLGSVLGIVVSIIFRFFVKKYVVQPTHKQFLPLAIVSVALCDEAMAALFFIIFFVENSQKKRDAFVEANK